MESKSSPDADTALSDDASAWIPTFSGTSVPSLRMARSNAIASVDCDSPSARADARVTCPTTLVPFGSTVRLPVFTASVVRASTASPAFAFLASTGLLNLVLNAVPDESPAFTDPGVAAAPAAADAEPDVCAAGVFACTDACPPAWALAFGLWPLTVKQVAAAITRMSNPRFIAIYLHSDSVESGPSYIRAEFKPADSQRRKIHSNSI
jgi:hypothetical protein